MELKARRINGENEESYIWRLGQMKDSGELDMSWDDIADLVNAEFREDESEYRTEAAYRKPYQQAKKFFESNVFGHFNDELSMASFRIQKQELQKEKQKLSDERAALNKTLREQARNEEDLKIIEYLIRENGKTTLLPFVAPKGKSNNDLVVCLSDFHLGQNTENYFGKYDSNIAETRLAEYLQNICEIGKANNVENIYLLMLGDLLNGEIHYTTQLENRENLAEQVQKTAEIVSAFTYEIAKNFNAVYVNGVAGNHSRTGNKDQVLRGNRLDNLIPWYMKAKLAHIENIFFLDSENYDPTIGKINIRGNEYLLVHGDWDSFSDSGVAKLTMMIGKKVSGIFYGHFHRCSYDDICGTKIVRSGSFNGTSDDYTVSKRLNGKPSQMVCLLKDGEIGALYPIELA